MNIRRIQYFVEGQCEEKLVNALKKEPCLILPGRCKVLNPVNEKLSPNDFISIPLGSIIVLVFDTDVADIDILDRNLKMIQKYAPRCETILVPQVKNIEDELLRATIVKNVEDLTKSRSLSNFKSDFCALKNCRAVLEKQELSMQKLWSMDPDGAFEKYPQESGKIKQKVSRKQAP